MIGTAFTSRQTNILMLLREKSSSRGHELIDQVLGGGLSHADIEEVCQLINDEYLMTGIQDDYEPNSYGRELNELVSIINAPRLRPKQDLHS